MLSSSSLKAVCSRKIQYRCFSNVSDLYKRAQAAIADTTQPPRDVSNETKLKMYGYFKQVESGPCTVSRPGMFEVVKRAKHDAWAQLGSMPKEEAMKQYVGLVTDLFDGKLPEVRSETAPTGGPTSAVAQAAPKMVTVASVAFPKLVNPADLANVKLNTVAVEKISEGVQHVILNRPKRGNAFDMNLWEDYQRAFEAIDASPDARVAILSGAGGNFSTGMDLSVFAEMQSSGDKESCEGRRREGISRFIQYLQDAVSAPENCAVPVIAAVSGNCIGGAIDIITACDLRYCTKDTSFCVKEIDLAIVADIGTLQRLPRIVGDQRAAELTLTARTFNGTEAQRMGLVLEVFDTEAEMMAHVKKVAADIAIKSPITARGVKKSILYSREHTVREGLQHVKMWNSAYLQTEDLLEAMRAVMSKQTPDYKKN